MSSRSHPGDARSPFDGQFAATSLKPLNLLSIGSDASRKFFLAETSAFAAYLDAIHPRII